MTKRPLPGSSTLMLIGIALVLIGALLLLSPAAVGGAVVRLVALVLAVTGVFQVLNSLSSRAVGHRAFSIILGVAVMCLGVLVWLNPELGSVFLTALLMLFFVVNGVWKIATSLRFRQVRGWVWLLLSGLLSLVFVWLLWSQWPLSGAWAIGVLVGLDLLLLGVALIVLARALRRLSSNVYFDTINL